MKKFIRKFKKRLQIFWNKLKSFSSRKKLLVIITTILLPVFIWFFPDFKEFKSTFFGNSDENLEVNNNVELRIGGIQLSEENKTILFYATPYITDSTLIYSTIPLTIKNKLNRVLDSIEVGFIFPPEAELHMPDYDYHDEPNLVDRFFNENDRHVSARYTIRRLYNDFVYLIDEPIFHKKSSMKIHLDEYQTYDDINHNKIRSFEFHNYHDIKSNDGNVEISWNFTIYCSGPYINTKNFRLGICRKQVDTKKELIILAKNYLLNLDYENQRNTSALVLFNEKVESKEVKKIIDSDTITFPMVREIINLEEVSELFVDMESKKVIEYNPVWNNYKLRVVE